MNNDWRYVVKQVSLVFFILFLGVLVFAIGLVVGYGMIGGNKNPWAILSPDTWQEIFNKFTGK